MGGLTLHREDAGSGLRVGDCRVRPCVTHQAALYGEDVLTLRADRLQSLTSFPDILDLLSVFEPLHSSKVLLCRHLQDEHVLLR